MALGRDLDDLRLWRSAAMLGVGPAVHGLRPRPGPDTYQANIEDPMPDYVVITIAACGRTKDESSDFAAALSARPSKAARSPWTSARRTCDGDDHRQAADRHHPALQHPHAAERNVSVNTFPTPGHKRRQPGWQRYFLISIAFTLISASSRTSPTRSDRAGPHHHDETEHLHHRIQSVFCGGGITGCAGYRRRASSGLLSSALDGDATLVRHIKVLFTGDSG